MKKIKVCIVRSKYNDTQGLLNTAVKELKKNNTKYLIFHGKIDDVVSPNQAIETHNFLIDQKIESQIIMDDNCGHSISPLAIEAINNKFNNWI